MYPVFARIHFGIVLLMLIGPIPVTASETEDTLVAIKNKLPFISLTDYLYNREPRDYSDDGKVKSAWTILLGLHSSKIQIPDLVKLSEHPNADIRALAVLALVAKEAPDFIPVCIRLLNDDAPTIPREAELFGRLPTERQVFTQPLTVGDIARRALQMVAFPASYLRQDKPSMVADAASWWALRKGNPDWLDWHEFLYKRATGGSFPPSEASQSGVKRFLAQVDSLPRTTRSWVLLYLADEIFTGDSNWREVYATENEMVEAVRELGTPVLIKFLKTGKRLGLREPQIDDPSNGKRFIVTYAKRLFTPADAQDLLKLNLYTAAADADPRMARSAIEAAMNAYRDTYQGWERGRAMATLADLGDETDRANAVKWFYEEPNESSGSSSQSIFLHEFERRRPQAWTDIARSIVAHPAFDRLKPLDVVYVARMIEKLGGEPVATGDGLRQENADFLRRRLKHWFQLASVKDPELRLPERFLETPEWSLDLGEFGTSLSVSADGKLLAVGLEREGRGVRVLEAVSGREQTKIDHEGRYLKVAFCGPDQALFCSGMNSREIRVWSSKTNETTAIRLDDNASFHAAATGLHGAMVNTECLSWLALPTLKPEWATSGRSRGPHMVVISPDSSLLATNDGWSKDILVIDAARGEQQAVLTGHAAPPEKLAFSPDSTMIASASEDCRLIVWNAKSGSAICRFHATSARFNAVVFSADSKSVFVSPEHGSMAAYSIPDGTPDFGIRCPGNWVQAVVASANGRHLFLMVQDKRSFGGPENNFGSRVECWRLP